MFLEGGVEVSFLMGEIIEKRVMSEIWFKLKLCFFKKKYGRVNFVVKEKMFNFLFYVKNFNEVEFYCNRFGQEVD